MNDDRERRKIEKEEERRRGKEEKARLKAEKQAIKEAKRRERREGVPLYLAMPEEPPQPPLQQEPAAAPEAEEAHVDKSSRKEERKRRKREKEEKRKRKKEEKARVKAEKQALKEAKKREKGRAAPPEERPEETSVRSPSQKVLTEEKPATAAAIVMEETPLPASEAVIVEAPPEMETVIEAPKAAPPEEIPPEEEKKRWLTRLRKSLSKSRLNFVAPLSKAIATRRFDEDFWGEVEDILVGADVGVDMTVTLVDRTRERMTEEKVKEPEELLALFREVLAEAIDIGDRQLIFADSGPSVFMIVGVNGTGKTTTIAKLGYLLQQDNKTVLLAAGDTFRAAGIEQLEEWGNRVGLHTVKHRQGADSAAVIHDAVESALARDMDVVIADTAGRLHTKTNLMEELKKIKRVAEREAQVTETLLVIDATTGQNGLIQAREFKEAVDVTGVVLTKLDGTAKGGIVVAIGHDLGIPIKFIGVGEGVEDLHPFDPYEFAGALFS
jgi:fused signal recognition particle receptor